MTLSLPRRPPVDPRAAELIGALNARAAARIELSWTMMEVEDYISMPAPVPPRLMEEFEAKMARLREAQERVTRLARPGS